MRSGRFSSMEDPTETTPTAPRLTFGRNTGRSGATRSGGAGDSDVLEMPSRVDARTAELRERIAAASRPLIGALLLRR